MPPCYCAEERLSPGEVVESALTVMIIRPGETLRLTISGKNLIVLTPDLAPLPLRNKGRHLLHTGGQRPSRLILPLIASGFPRTDKQYEVTVLANPAPEPELAAAAY